MAILTSKSCFDYWFNHQDKNLAGLPINSSYVFRAPDGNRILPIHGDSILNTHFWAKGDEQEYILVQQDENHNPIASSGQNFDINNVYFVSLPKKENCDINEVLAKFRDSSNYLTIKDISVLEVNVTDSSLESVVLRYLGKKTSKPSSSVSPTPTPAPTPHGSTPEPSSLNNVITKPTRKEVKTFLEEEGFEPTKELVRKLRNLPRDQWEDFVDDLDEETC